MSTRLVAIFSFLIFFVFLFTGAFGDVVAIWVGHEEILSLAAVCHCQTPCQSLEPEGNGVMADRDKCSGCSADCF